MFQKVLVANRGEIAVRVVRALREMNIASVAVFSDADRGALHVRLADEAAHIGAAPSSESYLNIERILAAAKKHRADAIHPGYGFLSENATFAAACETAGIAFIGPPADAIRRLGSKTAARILAKQANVPVVPGSEEPATHLDQARELARKLGYPVLLKAAAGGGGKGMRRVDAESELEAAIRDASSEAQRAFHNSEVYIEKVIEQPRHIEIQIAGDRYGNLVHLGERECSLQRRHQKIVEECPSPLVAANPEMRTEMGEAALRVARAAGYFNLGTVEFLADNQGNFYFLEVNTRLQVEHPVTELVTGLDLVQLQLRIAAGEALPFAQEDVALQGSAIECRICAEDPENQFFPSPGKIAQLREPGGPGIRVDSGVYAGWTVPLDYDPLLAKLIAWAPDRQEAIQRLLRALREYSIVGVETNLAFFREILEDPRFRAGDLHTGFIAELFARRKPKPKPAADLELAAALAAAAQAKNGQAETSGQPDHSNSQGDISRWLSEGRGSLLR
ncbi:MAG TPA: acetyl-CoA carboxylase biotin carboxylase subunit [Bryobacteraceae bacterium]|nr:acetyl-CoA carboxylase biotin carboxylase subunit [Bryobacteraceae bacterium]